MIFEVAIQYIKDEHFPMIFLIKYIISINLFHPTDKLHVF